MPGSIFPRSLSLTWLARRERPPERGTSAPFDMAIPTRLPPRFSCAPRRTTRRCRARRLRFQPTPDNVGVVGVQFKLDGANLGAEDTGAPYSVTWNTTTIANGTHSLKIGRAHV